MDKEYVMRVAATIREQLVTMTDTPVLMSWGIGEFMATVFKNLPGLKFHVNGRLFQGEVLICLNGSDYYEVYLRNGTDIECLSDEVCFDELGELIDRHIESGTDKEEYARFCELCYNNRFATLACRIFTLVGTGGPAPWRWPFPDR